MVTLLAAPPRLITVEEFWEITNAPENAEIRLELIDGEIIEMPSSSTKNTVIAMRIGAHLSFYADEYDSGYVAGADGGFRLDPYNAPQPDAAFIRKERVPHLDANNFAGAPDIAVEVISPSESRPQITRKIRKYLENGGQAVWVVYPEDEQVEVYQLNDDGSFKVEVLEKADTLDGGSILPNFQLPLSKIFR